MPLNLPIEGPKSNIQKTTYETQRVNNDLQAQYKIRPANDTCTQNEYSSCDTDIYTGTTDPWYEEKYHSDPDNGYNGDPVIVSNLEDNRRYVKNFTVLDDKHFSCKTQWFSVDLSYEIFSKNVGWAHPLLVRWPDYGAGAVDSGAVLCLECHDSSVGCGKCNGCYNSYYSCRTSCTSYCTNNCTTSCTTNCTVSVTGDICLGDTSATCKVGEVGINPDCKTSIHDDSGGCPNCHEQDLTDGPEDCSNNTAEICHCQTACFAGCTSQCDGCTSQIQTNPDEGRIDCSPCNDCTDCTTCVGNDSEHCRGVTDCGSCTTGCTKGTTDAVVSCPECVNSCTSACQNGLNNLDQHTNQQAGSRCNQVVGCGAGTVSCKLNTSFYECTGEVEWTCDNNNAEIYDKDPWVACTGSEVADLYICPLVVDGCGRVVACLGNCNTQSFSKTQLLCYFGMVDVIDPGKDVSDPTNQTCGTGCDSSCDGYCTAGCTDGCTTGCTNGCVDHCFGCTTGCTSGCTTACTRSCTTGCTQGTSNPCSNCTSGCTASCVTGCTATCASGCTASCHASCTSNCTSGCTSSCANCTANCTSNCTAGCTGNCVDHGGTCTSCIDSCTTGCRDGGTGCTCLSCTSSCTSGCTTGHLCYFWQ